MAQYSEGSSEVTTHCITLPFSWDLTVKLYKLRCQGNSAFVKKKKKREDLRLKMRGKWTVFISALFSFLLSQDFAFSYFLFPNFSWAFELIEVPKSIKLWANHKGLMRNIFIIKLNKCGLSGIPDSEENKILQASPFMG